MIPPDYIVEPTDEAYEPSPTEPPHAVVGRVPHWFDLGRRLRVLAGVDEPILATVPQDRTRLTAMGSAVLGTSLVAGLSMYLALAEMLGHPTPLLLGPALLWLFIILSFDRWLVSSGLSGSDRKRRVTIAMRAIIAVFLGVLIAEPIVLMAFAPAVRQQVHRNRENDLTVYAARLAECNMLAGDYTVVHAAGCGNEEILTFQLDSNPAAQIANSEDKLVRDQTQLDQDQARQVTLETTAQQECAGATGPNLSGRAGVGDRCRYDRDQAAAAADDVTADRAAIAQDHTDIQAATTDQSNIATDFSGQLSNKIAAKVVQAKGQQQSIGILERMYALNQLTVSSLTLLLGVIFVRVFLILVDCIPLIMKVSGGTTEYDQMVARKIRLSGDRDRALTKVRTDEISQWQQRRVADMKADDMHQDAKRRHHGDAAVHWLENAVLRRVDGQSAADSFVPPFEGTRPAVAVWPDEEIRAESHNAYDREEAVETDSDKVSAGFASTGLNTIFGADNTLRVVMLGVRGIGKTAFMAMLFQHLSEDSDGRSRGYHLTSTSHRDLSRHAKTIMEAGTRWPDATVAFKEVNLDCVVDVESGRIPTLRVIYVDYPGEALENGDLTPKDLTRLVAAVNRANVILIGVDGSAIREARDAIIAGADRKIVREAFFEKQLAVPLAEVRAADSYFAAELKVPFACPMQIVITKSDQLNDMTLAEVRDWLLSFPGMLSLVRRQRDIMNNLHWKRGIRLIPVSVTGPGTSVEIRTDGARITRKPRSIRPVNIDVPLAAVLPDCLDLVLQQMGPSEVRRTYRRHARRQSAYLALRLAQYAIDTLMYVRPSRVGYKGLGWEFAGAVSRDRRKGWLTTLVEAKILEVQRGPGERRAIIRSRPGLERQATETAVARTRLMREFDESLQLFEDHHEGWDLIGAIDALPKRRAESPVRVRA